MHFLILASLIPTISCFVQRPPPTQTVHGINRRAPTPATISLDPTANYVLTGTAVPTIAENTTDLDISEVSDGVNVIFSPQLANNIINSLRANCKDGASSCDAEQLVRRVISDPSTRLRPRQDPLTFLAVGVAALGILIQWFFVLPKDQPVAAPSGVHISGPTYDSLSSVVDTQPSTILVEYKNSTQTVTGIGGAATASAGQPVPSISLVQQEGDGQHIGDISITFPSEEFAKNLQEIIVRSSEPECHAELSKRAVSDFNCLVSGAEAATFNANFGGNEGPLMGLLATRGDIVAPPALLPALNAYNQWVQEQRGTVVLAAGVLVLLASYLIGNGIELRQSNIVSAPLQIDSNATSVTASVSSSSGSCSATPSCLAPSCSPTMNPPACNSGPDKGCFCTLEPQAVPYDPAQLTAQIAFFGSVAAALPTFTPSPECFLNGGYTEFDGQPVQTPNQFCACTRMPNTYAGVSYSTGLYPTLTSVPSSEACQYKTLPSSGITPGVDSSSSLPNVTSCRSITTTIESPVPGRDGFDSYCTCNDNERYEFSTTSIPGKTTTVYCPDATPTLNAENPVYLVIIRQADTSNDPPGPPDPGFSGGKYDIYLSPDKEFYTNATNACAAPDPRSPDWASLNNPLDPVPYGDLQNFKNCKFNLDVEGGQVMCDGFNNWVQCKIPEPGPAYSQCTNDKNELAEKWHVETNCEINPSDP